MIDGLTNSLRKFQAIFRLDLGALRPLDPDARFRA
jgi:hypothetical protein